MDFLALRRVGILMIHGVALLGHGFGFTEGLLAYLFTLLTGKSEEPTAYITVNVCQQLPDSP